MLSVDMRCGRHPVRLFGKIRITENNLVEFACRECRRELGTEVFHRFDFAGQLVETVDQDGRIIPDGDDVSSYDAARMEVPRRE